jgi:uncharacterized protein YndB with AHSA1/START domain
MTNSDNDSKLVVRRRFAVSREELFEAWTNADTMGLWMCPGDVISAKVHMDLRVGGSLLILMKDGGKTYEHRGVFTVIDPPSTLAFTWIAAATDMRETLVTVEFRAIGDQETELVITHDKLPGSEVQDRYRSGWASLVEKLADYLQTNRRTTG